MSHLDLVALLVRDYDAALDFFVNVLQFEIVEDVPSLTNDGRPKRWVVVRPVGGVTSILLARADGDHQAGIVGKQFAGRVGFFLRWMTSRPPTGGWWPRALRSSQCRVLSRTAKSQSFWISRATVGTSSVVRPAASLALLTITPEGSSREKIFLHTTAAFAMIKESIDCPYRSVDQTVQKIRAGD